MVPQQASAQRATGYDNPYYTTGTEVSPATLVPSVRKWYLPQRLYSLYDWRQEQYSNYARDHYERYTEVFLEGSPFYDVYGNYITQGWLVYDWTEDYPEDNGSIITKNPRFRSWFNNLLVSSSHSGQFYSALMVGDGIRTSLNPADVFQAALRRHSVGPYNRQVRPDHAVVTSQQHRRNFL